MRPAWLTTHRLVLGVILLASAGLRLAFFLAFREADLSKVPLLDAETYHEWAVNLVSGNPGWNETYWMGPLYPHWLALVYYVFGISMHAAQALQLMLTLLNVWLVYVFARRLLETSGLREVASAGSLLATALYAGYAAPVFYAGFLLMATVSTTTFLLAAWQAVRATEKPTTRNWVVLGLLTGLAGLARGNVLLLLFTLPVLLWRRPETRGRRLRLAALFAAGVLALVAPVTVRNMIVARDFVLLTSNAGINLLIGQQASGMGIFKPVIGDPEAEHDPSMEMSLEWEQGRDVKGSEVSRTLARRAWETFRDDFEHMPAHYARKVWRFWSGYELPQIAAYDHWHQRFWSLRVMPVPYLLFTAVGLAGFLVMPVRARWIVGVMVGTYFLSLLPFFPTSRYRQPIAPLMAVSTAVWLLAVVGSRARWPRPLARPRLLRLLGVTALLVLVLLPRWTSLDPGEVLWQVKMHEASRAGRLGKLRETLAHGREAEAARPGIAETPFRLALYMEDAGALPEAEISLRRAVARSPRNRLLVYKLGRNLEKQERYDEALAAFAAARKMAPEWAYPWLRTGLLLQRLGGPVEALPYMEEAHRLSPGNQRIRVNLGALLAENGRLDDARRVLTELVRDYPVYVHGWFNLALVELQAGDREAARRAVETVAAMRHLTRQEKARVARLRDVIGPR
ncbi:MAG: tetratricopeptide repeat protein [bacterium]|nr:tetratricopeptide repeat protein [bacterium]